MALAVAALVFGLAYAKSVEQVSVVENEITTITLPFGIKGYTPSNKDVVRIEPSSETSLRITALKRGRCDLEVLGDKNLVQKFEITVLGDLATELETLTSELDQVQEVRARIIGNSIRIDGEISSIAKWEYLVKVLRSYGSTVRNFVTFCPGPEVLIRMKETLVQAGFDVQFKPFSVDRKTWKANSIALALNKQTRIMTVQGKVYTPEQQALVMRCLASEKWLSLELDADKTADEFKIRGMIDVFVDKPQIRLSVAYMAIDDEDLKQIGNAAAAVDRGAVLNMGGAVDALSSFIHGNKPDRHMWSNAQSYGVDMGLNLFANFLKKNGISRVSETAYTVMESWDKDGAKFKSGGTMHVRTIEPNGGGVIGTAEMEEIEYGFMLKTVGGIDKGGKDVDMTVDFTLASIAQLDSWGVNVEEDATKQKLKIPLGRTTFLGGRSMINDSRLSPSGLPILRNTPMLNWFVSDSGTTINEKKLVIMVCPEIVDNTRDGNIDVQKEINIPVTTEGVKTTEQREEEKRPFSGGLWNPLNWFVF